MSLRELIAADVETVFLNTDDFAETITLIAPDGREVEITADVQTEDSPYEDNRAEKRRVERCVVRAKQATNADGDELVAFDHEDGPVEVKLGLAMVRSPDRNRKWDFTGQLVNAEGGMVAARFQRINIEHSGDLTPGMGR